MLNNFYLIF